MAAFLTMLDNGEVAAGGGSLNQQTVYGADVISRIAAALDNPANAERLHRLALASINQAVDSLNLSQRIREVLPSQGPCRRGLSHRKVRFGRERRSMSDDM